MLARWTLIPSFCVFLLCAATALAQASAPLTIEDVVRLERMEDPKASPDGKWIVYSSRLWESETNKTTKSLWLVSSDGKVSRRLTKEMYKSDTSPAWFPDGKTIAFSSNRSGSQQIWTLSVEKGALKQLTHFPVGINDFRISPQGDRIAFSAEVYPDADLIETAKRDKDKDDSQVKAMKFDNLMIRHWDTWFEGKRNHVFVMSLLQPKQAIDLMKAIDGDSPVKPFGGADDYAWSSDGHEIAYTMTTGKDAAWSTDLNIHLVPVAGGTAKCITCENKASDSTPSYSPDGKTIAYLSMARPGFESDRNRIKLYDRATGTTRTLTENWDRSPASLLWEKDGKSLVVTVNDDARKKIVRVQVASGERQILVEDHNNDVVGILPSGRIVFTQDSFEAPADLWTAAADGSDRIALTHVNKEKLKNIQFSKTEEFRFEGAKKETVQSWLFKPIHFVEGKKYPVAFVIHGGPQSGITDHFNYRWNPQLFASAGYAVIVVNFHGSDGFGQGFTDAVSGDWGGAPFDDLMKGLDYALEHYPWLDKTRVAALGASFGGWMINWINGHTDRFRCLVNHDGIFDTTHTYYTTEELWFPEWEFKGTPWENPKSYAKFSPSLFVAEWKTPTLVIHSGKDFRLVDGEGIATFTALQRRKIPSQLLYFPDENHWVLKPKNSIVWYQTVLAWLARWT